ncbi:MAG: hypothetical protein ABR501_06445 [Pyrinomonadaceae bacterium]
MSLGIWETISPIEVSATFNHHPERVSGVLIVGGGSLAFWALTAQGHIPTRN